MAPAMQLPLPPIMRLALETLDQIASYIDLHRDLLAFALASHACANLVIPRHTDYRVIRIRYPMPYMWAHLARRADLARNVREVHIAEIRNYEAPDHAPAALIDKAIDARLENNTDAARIRNLCRALGHMQHLHTFSWSCVIPPGTRTNVPLHEAEIFTALSRCTSLRRLSLAGVLGSFAKSAHDDPTSTYPLWTISNLESLSLEGNAWIKPRNAPHIFAMLQRSPKLQSLTLPMEYSKLGDCRFPELTTLNLNLQAGTTPGIDRSRARFIEEHPSIENLHWVPINKIELSPTALPNLKRLSTNHHLLLSLDSAMPRPLECLNIYKIDDAVMAALKEIDGSRLRRLSVHNIHDFETVQTIVEMFPALRWFSMSSPYFSSHPSTLALAPIKLDELLWIFSRLPELEVFRGEGLWRAVHMNKDHMHTVIAEVVALCPRLRELDHCDYDERRHDWKRIAILRQGDHVTYEVRKPPIRQLFEPMGNIFGADARC